MKLYLDSGADYDIITAIHLDDFNRVKAILAKWPAYANDFRDQSPLRTAASLGRLKICRFLIEKHHVDVNDLNRGFGYPIIKEALTHPRIVELLIKSGANLKTRITWRGYSSGSSIVGEDATVLHHAAADGVPETITLLIDNGVDTLAMDQGLFDRHRKQTALEVAARFGKGDNALALEQSPHFLLIADGAGTER